jgi:hypothetical protein
MSPHVNAIVVLKTLSLVIGGLITYFAYRASIRTGAPALRALAVGFGIVTLGALTAGVVDQVTGVDDRTWALFVESALTTAGFGVILYSLYAD